MGDGTYTISESERLCQGTTVTLHLKDVDLENGIEDYTDQRILSSIIKRRSDFISYPIICKHACGKIDQYRSQELNIGPERTISTVKKLNSMNPIWCLVHSEITEAIYSEYYRHISHDWAEPFKTISLTAQEEGECQALLYIPSKTDRGFVRQISTDGLRLYVKGVMVMERCEELLPGYLRFIKGVINSEYLPSNISLQTLQDSRHIVRIRKWLTKRVLDTLEELFERDYDKYLQFWGQFGWALEEGASSDYENRGRILSLLITGLDK
jgi:molecular chaperone HtpG